MVFRFGYAQTLIKKPLDGARSCYLSNIRDSNVVCKNTATLAHKIAHQSIFMLASLWQCINDCVASDR